MQNYLRLGGFGAAALAFAGFAPSAVAQNVRVLTCQDVGGGRQNLSAIAKAI